MYRITFVLDLFKGPEEQEVSHQALRTLLMALMYVDIAWLKANPQAPLLYESGVRYEEEPPGQEDWQDVPTCLRMKVGDCEDLACWRAAELRVRFGIDAYPIFTCKKPNSNWCYKKKWLALAPLPLALRTRSTTPPISPTLQPRSCRWKLLNLKSL